MPLRVEAEEIRPIGGHTNAAQVRELIAWIEGGPEHRGSGRKARATVEIMMALYESARQHHVVHLPLQEEGYPLVLMVDEGRLPVEEPGKYDIRGFLKRDAIDEKAYAELKSQGMGAPPSYENTKRERAKGIGEHTMNRPPPRIQTYFGDAAA